MKKKAFTLIEIIITIALLSFVSVVILQIFVKSNQRNILASEKSMASLIAANAIEANHQQSLENNTESLTYYDENWQITEQNPASYSLKLQTSSCNEKGIYQLKATVERQDGSQILSYQVQKFSPRGASQ